MQRELSKRGKTRALPAMTRELKQIIKDNSDRLIGIDGRKNKKLTPGYEAFKRRMGLYPQPDFRGVTGSFLDNAIAGKDKLTPHPSDAKKAEGLMRKRKPYPQKESDIAKKSMKILERSAEKAASD
jgi:hypothetical protein